MKPILLFLLFSLAWNPAFTQPSLPKNVSDSLLATWNDATQPDTIRLKAIYEYAWEGYLYSQPDSTYFYAGQMYHFAAKGGYKKEMSIAHYAMGIALFYLGENKRALDHFFQSLAICEEIGYLRGISNSLSSLGVVYSEMGDFNRSIEFYLSALNLIAGTGNKGLIASTTNNLASVYTNKGDHAIAMEYFIKSHALYEEAGSQRGMANVTSNMGSIYLEQGDYQKALDHFSQCLKYKEEKEEKKGIATATLNVGTAYLKMGENEKAIEYFERSFVLLEETGDQRGLGIALYNTGVALRDLGFYERSLSLFEQAVKIQEKIDDADALSETLCAFSLTLYKQGNFQASVHYGNKSMALAHQTGYLKLIQNSARVLYLNYNALNQADKALEYLSLLRATLATSLSINYFTLSEHEKELYFATMENDFGRYYDFTLARRDIFPALCDTAFNLALQNKGLVLKSTTAMRSAVLNSGDTALISDYEEWLELKQRIADLYSTGEVTKELEEKANNLEKELVKKSALFSDFDKLKTLDWKDVRASLKNGECAIEFIHFKSEMDTANPVVYAALLVKKESVHPEMVRLCTEADLTGIFGSLQGNDKDFVETVYGSNKAQQNKLYQQVWKPLEKHLRKIKTIYYSPSGLLHKVALAATPVTQDVLLSDRYKFRTMSTTGALALNTKTEFDPADSFMLMGGVDYNSPKTSRTMWSYLPGSLEETEAINDFLLAEKIVVNNFTAAAANEDVFKEQVGGAAFLHVATHGFFFPDPEEIRETMRASEESEKELNFRGSSNYANWSFVNNVNPLMRSGVVLAGANDVWTRDPLEHGEDGVLTALEVSNLNLQKTKLVVLSACETGLGDIRGSEGVYGLQRAFKMAGVKYLIMSLWQVPDKETAEFMQLFYKNLLKLKDIPAAFQKTQKVMREKYDPYYWGAFVLIE